jgi:hypothetical protein
MRLLIDLRAFYTEHRLCGRLKSGIDGGAIRLACECGASILRRVDADEPQPAPESPPSGLAADVAKTIAFSQKMRGAAEKVRAESRATPEDARQFIQANRERHSWATARHGAATD